MSEEHEKHEGTLGRIFLKIRERAREDEWNRIVESTVEEMLVIASCYDKWLKLGNALHSQNAFNAFCAEMDYAPLHIPQGAMYYAVQELREIASKRAMSAVTGE